MATIFGSRVKKMLNIKYIFLIHFLLINAQATFFTQRKYELNKSHAYHFNELQ